MAIQVSHLPHVSNTKVWRDRWDPMHSSIFSVEFTVPFVLRGEYDSEEMCVLSLQVLSVEGLDGLQKSVGIYTQKYLGTDVAFFNPKIDNTTIDFNITFNLNLRNVSDAYVYKIFKEWYNLMYDMATGVRAIKDMCCAETMNIYEANRDGTIWRQITFRNVFVTSIQGMNSLDYTSSDPRILSVGLHADYWEEILA